MAKKCVIWVFFCFFYNIAFSFAFMLTEKLFLLHRLLFIPYFNNPQGGGEGREGGYSQWWPLRPILAQKGRNEKVGISPPEEYDGKNMIGYREFCHFFLYYDQKVLLKDFMAL